MATADPARARTIAAGLERLAVPAPPGAIDQLCGYLEALSDWNRAYNLTAVRDIDQMVVRHVLDSAAVAPLVTGETVLDVGSGAGLPGLVLAVLQPQRQFTLLDSNGKKVRFIRHALRTLALTNAQAVQARLEQYTGGPFDTVIARAFAEPEVLLAGVRTLCRPGGRVLAMQGRRPDNGPSADGFESESCVALDVPGLDAERHVLIYRRWPESSQ